MIAGARPGRHRLPTALTALVVLLGLAGAGCARRDRAADPEVRAPADGGAPVAPPTPVRARPAELAQLTLKVLGMT